VICNFIVTEILWVQQKHLKKRAAKKNRASKPVLDSKRSIAKVRKPYLSIGQDGHEGAYSNSIEKEYLWETKNSWKYL